MEHDDREYTDMLNEGLKDVEPGAGLHGKVRDGIARNVVHLRRRNTALGAVVIAVILTMGLSAVTPVFGRNGTLSQVITAIAAERQAKKISKTLGKSPVEQTEAALQTSEATGQTLSDSAVSDSEGVLAVIISKKSGASVIKVLGLRATGLGWGVIMAQLKVSGRDIGKAMSQVKGQGENSKPAVSNADGNKIVVNGEITGVLITSPITSSITVADKTFADKTFAIVPATQLKYHGKAITPAEIADKLSAPGKLYATVQGTKQPNTAPLANLIIVQDGVSNELTNPSNELTNPSNELTNPSNELTNPSNERAAVSNEQQLRGKVTAVTAKTATTATTLRIDGFDHQIILNADTKVEQVGAGSVDRSAIRDGQTVQVHVRLSDGAYLAQQVHIEDKSADDEGPTDTSVTTWKGTIAAIDPDAKSITLTGVNPPFVFHIVPTSVLQDASYHTLTLAALQTLQNIAIQKQKVTIQGRLLADGTTVDIVKLTVTTVNTTTTPKPTNPGKGNGKN